MQKIVKGSRPKRAPVGSKGRLTVANKQPDREYRFVNDRDGRVEMFQQAGWDVELAENHKVGDRRADVASVTGSAARYPVGLGDYSVLMSIPKEWYEEDQAEKQRMVDASEQTIQNEVKNSGYKNASFKIERD